MQKFVQIQFNEIRRKIYKTMLRMLYTSLHVSSKQNSNVKIQLTFIESNIVN